MEELRSTEVLDREILEDARKKAFKILKTADDSVQSQAKRWERKTQRAINEIRKSYEKQSEKVRQEIHARGPLDKRRLRSETAEIFMRNAMENFLKGLDRNTLLLILEREMKKRLAECTETEIAAEEEAELICRNLSKEEAEKILRSLLPNIKLNKWKILEEKNTSVSFPMITINTLHLRITASVDYAAKKLLKDKRAELASSLLGVEALND